MVANTPSDAVESITHQAAQAADHVNALAHAGLDSMRDASRRMLNGAQHASESTTRYIKEEPLKSILIAAATGAALMALLNVMCRPGTRG
jgi:ElaB/YqjD/DUF883 family membrane-anchored ribosome-binding protein